MQFLAKEPKAEPYFRRWLGATEFLNGTSRWYLWLGNCQPSVLREMPLALERVERVRAFRKASKSAPTKKLAEKPTQFHVENMPKGRYLLIPRHSSESRRYLPIGFIEPSVLTGDACLISQAASLFEFGVLESLMHNAWLRAVCGRIKSDYRYSAGIVYNNFPWPDPTGAQREEIFEAAQGVLDCREAYLESTLADLYDPLTMPADLLKAHQQLDRAVDAAYGRRDFKTEADRVAFLFERYLQLTAPLALAESKPKSRRKHATS